MNPTQLRRQAEAKRQQAKRIMQAAEANLEAARAKALRLIASAAMLDQAAEHEETGYVPTPADIEKARKVLKLGPEDLNLGTMDSSQADSRALKIAKTRTKGKVRPKALQAIYDAGLTPNAAAALVGSTRDVLKQAWGEGRQFREIKPDWKKTLAKHGIPEDVWPTHG